MGIYFHVLIPLILDPFCGLQKKIYNNFSLKLRVQESISIKNKPLIQRTLMPGII